MRIGDLESRLGPSDLLWQHWIVKPLCPIVVVFPLTRAGTDAGSARLLARLSPATGSFAAPLLVGALYLLATATFN